MRFEVAKNAGFCAGVKAAFDKALELAKKYGKLYTFGELVHNELVTEYLQSNHIFCINADQIDRLKKGDAVLIRAHGVPPETEERLRATGADVYDATCPVVKRNQLLVQKRSEAGDEVVVVGDISHDEVVGLVGYAKGAVRVVDPSERLEIGSKNTSIVFQTTVLKQKYDKIVQEVNNFQKNNDNLVEIFNTICYTTKAKQDEARRLAATSDAILVLGSRTSANTRRLFEVANSVNKNVFFVQSVSELQAQINHIKDFQFVSAVAGASTPPWLIREVTKLMSETTRTAAVEAAETEVRKEATLQEQNVAEQAEPQTMDDLLKATRDGGYTNYRPGKRIKGTVISACDNGIFVAIGGKKDGFIDKTEVCLDGNYNPADYKEGDEVFATILSVNKEYVSLSKKAVDAQRKEEEEAEKALSAGEFSLQMTEVVNGGLRGRLGQYTIFVPASQIRIGYVSNLEDYKGKTLRLMLMPPKEKPVQDENAEAAEAAPAEEKPVEEKPARRSKYLFASQRMVLEKEKKEKEDAFWSRIHVNDRVTGKVKRFTPFGAFVNVGGFDCLAHISELSWNKIDDPAKVLTIGESYDFVVLKLDRATGRISLGYKQLQKKPYEAAAEKFPVGTVIKGKVERIFNYGAFISIDEGVDGLVHVSQISHNWVKDANEVLTVGQEVEAKIIGFDDNRITLSIKALLPAPEQAQAADGATEEATEEEKAARRNSRNKRFEQKVAGGQENKPRKQRKEAPADQQPTEWVSGSSNATLGDLFKGLNLTLPEDAPAADNQEEK